MQGAGHLEAEPQRGQRKTVAPPVGARELELQPDGQDEQLQRLHEQRADEEAHPLLGVVGRVRQNHQQGRERGQDGEQDQERVADHVAQGQQQVADRHAAGDQGREQWKGRDVVEGAQHLIREGEAAEDVDHRSRECVVEVDGGLEELR